LPLGLNLAIAATPGSEILPHLALSPASDECIIVWQGWHDSEGTTPDIYGLIYSPPRFLQWLPQVSHSGVHFALSSNSLAQ
jgi:hypothetical protein